MSWDFRGKGGQLITWKGVIALICVVIISWFAIKYSEYYYSRSETVEWLYNVDKN